MDRWEKQALDRHITGNWGEDELNHDPFDVGDRVTVNEERDVFHGQHGTVEDVESWRTARLVIVSIDNVEGEHLMPVESLVLVDVVEG